MLVKAVSSDCKSRTDKYGKIESCKRSMGTKVTILRVRSTRISCLLYNYMCKKLLSFFYYWQCSNTESARVGRFLKLLISGSCVSLSVCLSVCLSVYKNAIFISRTHRKMWQIYVKYSLYIQSYYFNFTFVRASLWRVQLCNQ